MPLTETLKFPRSRVIFRVSWSVAPSKDRFASEYTDVQTAQLNARDIESYEHIERVRIDEIHEDREPREGVFQLPNRFNREDPL